MQPWVCNYQWKDCWAVQGWEGRTQGVPSVSLWMWQRFSLALLGGSDPPDTPTKRRIYSSDEMGWVWIIGRYHLLFISVFSYCFVGLCQCLLNVMVTSFSHCIEVYTSVFVLALFSFFFLYSTGSKSRTGLSSTMAGANRKQQGST